MSAGGPGQELAAAERAPDRPVGAQVLASAERLRETVARLGAEINAAYAGRELTLVVVLHGALVFAADLMRTLRGPLRLALVTASSYRGASTEPGALHATLPEDLDVKDRDVLLVDDILDTGRTLHRLRQLLREAGARSVASAVLLDKPARRELPIEAEFCGLVIPDRFVVGYGLDHDGRWRHLPEVVALPAG